MTVRFIVPGLMAGFVLAASSAAHAEDCADLMAGMLNGATMPVSVAMTMQAPGGQPRTSHSIFTGSKLYVEVNGEWHTMPMTAKEMTDQVHESDKGAKKSCHRVGSERVNGQASTVYMAHVENQGSVSDNKVWIGDAPKRMLKSDIHIADGQHIMADYDYDHIQPPASAK
jgi:hypothetical protein